MKNSSVQPDAEAYYNRGVAYYKLGDIKEAINDFENAALEYLEREDGAGYKQAKAKVEKLQENAGNSREE